MNNIVKSDKNFDFEHMNLRDITDVVHRTNIEHGFSQSVDDIEKKLLLVIGEINEAYEEIRAGHKYNEIYYKKDNQGGDKPEGFPVELADAIIRCLGIAAILGIDIQSVIQEKAIYNESRPWKHGKLF